MLKRATELRPDDGAITDSVGWAYYRLGQYDKAVEWLERASEQKGDDATIVEHLGDAYWHVGRRREARFQWERALNQKPDKDRMPVIQDKLGNGLNRGQRQADRLRKGGRQQAGRLTAPAAASVLRAGQGQSLAERRRPPRRRLSPARLAGRLHRSCRRDRGVAVRSPRRSTVDGPFAATLADEADNLVLKAARLLADRAGVAPRAALRLTKHIPVAAGLGGGSADAAAALRALIELWRVALPVEELFDLAARLGADVPMCLAGRAALVSGIGERLAPAPPLPPCAILLVNPGVPLPTPEVFAARHGALSRAAHPVRAVDGRRRASPRCWPSAATTSPTPRSRCGRRSPRCSPSCGTSEGVLHAAMSGSGATCFALYETPQLAERAAERVPPLWWRHAGALVG